MKRPALISLFAFLALGAAAPALAVTPALDLDRVRAVAKQEGLPLFTVRQVGSTRLQLGCGEAMPRAAFLRRAGLLAYVVFKRTSSQIKEIEITDGAHGQGQTCRIQRTDYEAYLADRIPKAEYERRLAYRAWRPATMAGHPATAAVQLPPPPLPPVPGLPTGGPGPFMPGAPAPLADPGAVHGLGPSAAQGLAASVPMRTPAAPPVATMLAMAYGMSLGGSHFDHYQLEFGYPLLSSLDLRPSLQIISPFSPLNYLAGASPTQGLSLACDLLGTSRQHPGEGGWSFEGGLGARVASLQASGSGADGGTWPALHLRLGARWNGLTFDARYPLLHRDLDPTGTWEASVGYSVPFSAFGHF